MLRAAITLPIISLTALCLLALISGTKGKQFSPSLPTTQWPKGSLRKNFIIKKEDGGKSGKTGQLYNLLCVFVCFRTELLKYCLLKSVLVKDVSAEFAFGGT